MGCPRAAKAVGARVPGTRKAWRKRKRGKEEGILWAQAAFNPPAPVPSFHSFFILSEIVILTAASTELGFTCYRKESRQ